MVFYHEGDLGDIISCLPAVRALGGGDFRVGAGQSRETMFGTRFESLKPLLLAQPYIRSCEWTFDRRGIDVDFSSFRERYRVHDNLALQHAAHAGVSISLDPWLTIPADDSEGCGPVICRTSRYHNPSFPWRRLLKNYPNAAFVGLMKEWNDFCDAFGEVRYVATPNLLDLAQVVARAYPLITNQTLAFWLGAGLGIPFLIQETHLADQNSIIERPNYFYTRDLEEINAL